MRPEMHYFSDLVISGGDGGSKEYKRPNDGVHRPQCHQQVKWGWGWLQRAGYERR